MVYFKLCIDIFLCISSNNHDLTLIHDLCGTVVSLGNISFLKSSGFTVVELCTCYSVCWYLYSCTEKGTLTKRNLLWTNNCASVVLCFTGNLQAWENKMYRCELVYKLFLMEMMWVGRPAESLLLFLMFSVFRLDEEIHRQSSLTWPENNIH